MIFIQSVLMKDVDAFTVFNVQGAGSGGVPGGQAGQTLDTYQCD